METRRKHKPLPDIFDATCRAGEIEPGRIRSMNPGKMIAVFKHVGIYLARQHGHPLREIATTFGLKSHVSASYAIKQVEKPEDEDLIDDVQARIMEELYGEGRTDTKKD